MSNEKKTYGHVMIDLETLSCHTNAAIMQVALVEFNKETGEIGNELLLKVRPNEWNANRRRHIDGETVMWWFRQSEEARKSLEIKEGEKDITQYRILKKVTKFIEECKSNCSEGKEVVVWGNGATMDITILQSLFEDFEYPLPWKYWAVNDVRTVVDLKPEVKKEMKFEGVKHNALDDCKHQIKYLVKTLQCIIKTPIFHKIVVCIEKDYQIIEPKYAKVGDVLLYDRCIRKKIIVSITDVTVSEYLKKNCLPVGVVVIPGSHNVYGTGECGVMSIVPMNYSTPDTGGTSEQSIYWGGYGTDISKLTNYNVVNYVGSDGTVNSTVQGTTCYANLPSDNFSTVANPYDTDTWYCYNDSDMYIPSPYLTDDSRNPAYYQTSSPASTANALSDFDGTGNTNKLIGLSTSQSDWKTATTIKNSYKEGYYPAACCTWRYSCDGTKQGDWYLPACGELGYIMPKFNKINETITTLKNVYNIGVQLESTYDYWSSSEYSSGGARRVYTDDGNVGYGYKYGGSYVRAFVRVGA